MLNPLKFKEIPNRLPVELLQPWKLDQILASRYLNKTQSCQSRKIGFELTYTQWKKLVLTRKCYYTGVPITILDSKASTQAQQCTLDRIDSSKAYTVENTVACSYLINQAKSSFERNDSLDYTDLIALADKLRQVL